MPFERPDLATLARQSETDFETRLPGADARTRRSNIAVLSRVLAGALHAVYGFVSWISRQVLVDTAEAEFIERHAAIYGLARKAAGYSGGDVTFAGTSGAILPQGTLVQRADGVEFATDTPDLFIGSTLTTAVTAIEPGAAGDTAAGTALSLISPVAGVSSAATVAAGGIANGADQESDDSLRDRVLARIQQPPHGGAAHDYVAWARAVPGVTRAWATGDGQGPGGVAVRFTMDDTYDGGIPEAADVTAVADYIAARRPVTAVVLVAAPVPVALNFTISGLTIGAGPTTATVRAAIEAELADLIRREAEPGSTVLLSHINEAISIAAGETDHTLVSPAANVTHAAHEMAVMGAVTWL